MKMYYDIIGDLVSELDIVNLKDGEVIMDGVSYKLCQCQGYNGKLNYSKSNNFNIEEFKELLVKELNENNYYTLDLEIYKSKNRYNEVYINIDFKIEK